MKDEYIKILKHWLTFTKNIEKSRPAGPNHPDYGPALGVGNVMLWRDQWGYNVFDTPKKRMAEVVLQQYERRHGKPLYKPEVRKSDPVPHAPPPRSSKSGGI
jgi:hypothetical protein